MADEKTQVLIELKLQVKELKKQMDEAKNKFKDLKKSAEGSMGSKEYKQLLEAMKKVTEATKEASQAFVEGEKKKQRAAKGATDEIKKQKKELGGLVGLVNKGLGKMGAPGRFIGGMGAGLGLGALTKPVTARGMGGMLGRGITAGIGGIGQFFMSGISSAYQQYLQYGQAVGGLVGMGTPGQLRGGRRAAGGVGGAGLGYSMIETAQQARGIGRATGNIGAVYRGQQFGRAYGMDVGEAGAYMGMIRQAGYGFGGMRKNVLTGGMEQVDQRGSRELQKIMEAGLMSGIEKARLPEFLQGVAQITQQVGSRISGDVNVAGIARFQAMLGRTGAPGFQGARGAAVAAQLGTAITRPGGGEAGQAMMLQALGFGKPGGTRSYYDALKMQQQGLERPETVLDMFNEVYSQLGQKGAGGTASVNQEANLALSEMTGLSLDQIETLGDLVNSGMSQEELLKEISKETKKAEPVEKQALKAMRSGFGGTVSYLAGIQDAQIGLGGQFSKQFQAMQKFQLKALQVLAEYLPKIWGTISDLYIDASTWFSETFAKFVKDPGEGFRARTKKLREELAAIDPAYGGTAEERIKALREERKKRLEGMKDVAGGASMFEAYAQHGVVGALAGVTGEDVARRRAEGLHQAAQAGRTIREENFMRRMMSATRGTELGRQGYRSWIKAVPELGRILNKIQRRDPTDEAATSAALSRLAAKSRAQEPQVTPIKSAKELMAEARKARADDARNARNARTNRRPGRRQNRGSNDAKNMND